MRRSTIVLFVLVAVWATAVSAQPTLDSLWPNADGLRFNYEYHRTDLIEEVDIGGPAYLVLEGEVTTPGGPAQNLLGAHPHSPAKGDRATAGMPGLVQAIWRARPDLRDALALRFATAQKVVEWRPSFLHTGYFMKSTAAVQMWQDSWSHPTWTYLDGEPSLGASFTHQLLPGIVDDIFLHGTVTALDAMVTTANGTYANAVKVDYLVDLGTGLLTDETGNLVGAVHGEYSGHVYYVPEVGPVQMLEEHMPVVWADCGEQQCPEEITRWIGVVTETQTLSLVEDPVAETARSWGDIKAMYR
jgi:hypothetical protein